MPNINFIKNENIYFTDNYNILMCKDCIYLIFLDELTNYAICNMDYLKHYLMLFPDGCTRHIKEKLNGNS